MAKKISIPKKKISNNEPEDLTPQITWFYNPKYYPLEEKENVPKVHIQLRELLKEIVENWCMDFNKRAELTTNFEEFINLNLSPRGLTFKYEPNRVFPFKDYDISRHYMRGYDSAIKGDNPFMDEIKVPGVRTLDLKGFTISEEKMITQNLADFMNGYYASMLDSYVMNFKKDEKEKNKNATSKLTFLLQMYYEKGCPLKKQQVEKIAKDNGFPITTLVNRWIYLKKDSYQHNGNINNIKEFISSYKALMVIFKESNNKLFNDVKNHYEQLKETYPDLTY